MSESEKFIASGDDIATALNAINECIQALTARIVEIEKYLSELPTPDKIYYKPKGYDDYLTMKENFDELYKKVGELTDGV